MGFGKGGSGVPSLRHLIRIITGPDLLYNNSLCSNDEQSLALLHQTETGEVLEFVSEMIACLTDVVE